MSEYIIEKDTPILELECAEAFGRLTDREMLYAHHLSEGSWVGSLITLYQTSPESPVIFTLLNRLFSHDSLDDLKTLALESAGFTDVEFDSLLMYTAAVVANMGNYRGFGDLKFVPDLKPDALEKLLSLSKASATDRLVMDLWHQCKDSMFSLNQNEKCLGFAPGGTTTYFSANCTEEDSKTVQEMMVKNKIEGYNNRVFKDADGTYEIRCASVRSTEDPEEAEFMKNFDSFRGKLRLTRGDYAPILKQVNKHLEKAIQFAANDNERQMLVEYIRSFRSGDLAAHKEGSRFWVKNKGPVVETYIGFIETYRDPAGMRGEFESFVSLVDKERTKKFGALVTSAESLLSLMPWPKEFEKDKFLQPDFTSLDVLTFTGSGIPAGINIPNYTEIKQSEGFKNVSLGNVIASRFKDKNQNFLSQADSDLFSNNVDLSFEVQVGLHELLGHGSGKLFQRSPDGSLNFTSDLVNPLDGKPVSSWYEPGQTYDSQFGALGSCFEECRAECVGLYLCLEKSVMKVFGCDGEKADEVIYVNWLLMVKSGIEGLKMYKPDSKKWLQSHSQARFVIARVLMQNAPDLLKIEITTGKDGQPDLLIKMDATKIHNVGKAAIGKFLLQLQVLKATADSAAAQALFDKYSQVSDELEYPFIKIREIVVQRRKARRILVQATTELAEGQSDCVKLIRHEASLAGFIQSFVSHFPEPLISSLFGEMS